MKSVEQKAREAMLGFMWSGQPFKSVDAAQIGERAGLQPYAASIMANQLTQREKNKTVRQIRKEGSAYVWIAIDQPDPKPPRVPEIAAPVVEGPWDVPAALEGPNTGLTEQFAEKLWETIGAGQSSCRTLKASMSPMEAHGWRSVSDQLIRWLSSIGFTGPGGAQPETGWTYGWHYDCAEWMIADGDGAAVALVPNDSDIPLLLASPRMRDAITAALERFDTAGTVKRSDIEALRAALPQPPDPQPEKTDASPDV